MKRILSIILTISVLILSITVNSACKVRNSGTDIDKMLKEIEIDADEEYSGNLNIRTWSEDTEVLIMNSYIDAFNKIYPKMEIKEKKLLH